MFERIKEILLQHQGKENKVTSKEISLQMGFPMEDTQSVSRKAIWSTAQMFGLPLVSSNQGYYLAKTEDELNSYNENIEKRIQGMRSTQQLANKNYKEWNKK